MAPQRTNAIRAGQRLGGRPWGRHVARRYEIRPGGLLYIAITLFIAIGAINSQNNLLFWLFGMAVGAIIISGIASGAALMGLHARRIAPTMIEAGSRAPISYELRHRGRFIPAFALLIREIPAASPAEGRVGTLEPAWTHIDHLSPGSKARGRCWALAGRRGMVRLDRFEVSSTFPFGLFRKALIFEQPELIAITPVKLEVRERLLEAMVTGFERGAPHAARSGISDEFYGLRAYVPGDSPRTIAWRRSAALGELVVRQFAAPMPPRIVLELHPDLAEADDRTKELTIALVSSLAASAGARGLSVGIDAPWAGYRSPLGGGFRLTHRRLHELASLELETTPGEAHPMPMSRSAGRAVLFNSSQGAPPRDRPAIDVSDESLWLVPGAKLPSVLGPPGDPQKPHRFRRGRNARAPSRVKEPA